MEIQKIPYDKIPQFSSKDIAYLSESPALRPFYKYPPKISSFPDVILDKQKDLTDRALLVKVLQEQYQSIPTNDLVHKNIQSLAFNNTFTITTAHQPCLFTGPLYYLYKIASTLHLTRRLSVELPQFQFVPVFVSGAEDHDFGEINHAHLYGKSIVWQNEQSGGVGGMSTESLPQVLTELEAILGVSDAAKNVFDMVQKCYTRYPLYGQATVALVNELFKDFGLVVIDMNHPELKRRFIPVMQKELLEQPSVAFIEQAAKDLELAGFSGQAHPRDINLFYFKDQLRSRIVLEEGRYKVLQTSLEFSPAEILEELHTHPEHFSPNVVLRPLYQEIILPNLAYIGGGGEIAYWLERMQQFQFFGVNFPMLIRRNSLLWVDKGSAKKLAKLELSIEDLLQDTEILIKKYLHEHSEHELNLDQEKTKLEEIFDGVARIAESSDPTLVKTVLAEKVKQVKSLEQIELRLLRAEKQKQETTLNQIKTLKEKLFPANGLQERHDNFLPLFVNHGQEFLSFLVDNLAPFDKNFLVVFEG